MDRLLLKRFRFISLQNSVVRAVKTFACLSFILWGVPLASPASAQEIFITVHGGHLVYRYVDGIGAEFTPINSARFPIGVTFGPDGNLYVTSFEANTVVRYNGTTGAPIDIFIPSGSGGLSAPFDVIFGPDGNAYVVSNLDSRILRYDGTTGGPLPAPGRSGAEFVGSDGGLARPTGAVFGPDGKLYVASSAGNKVLRYDGTTGALEGAVVTGPTGGTLYDLAFGPGGKLFIIDNAHDSILRADLASGIVDTFVPSGSGGLNNPAGLEFGPDGKLYVASYETASVLRYSSSTGGFIDAHIVGSTPPFFGSVFRIAFRPEANQPPVAHAGDNQAIHAGQSVGLNGLGSTDDSTPSEDLAYNWSFVSVPTDSGAVLSGGNTATPAFEADRDGDYVVQLIVADAGGLLSDPAYVTISSFNSPPNAEAGNDQATFVGDLVSLDGSASSDPEHDFFTYSWTLTSWPAGSETTLSAPESANPTLVPDVAGTYAIAIVVTDLFGASSLDEIIVVVLTTGDFAQQEVGTVINSVAALPAADVTTSGNQNALLQSLIQAVEAVQQDDVATALSKLAKAIERTDGCALRGSPDQAGGGGGTPPSKDYVTNCQDQLPLYLSLKEVEEALIQTAP